jgi:hypothetical protein
MNLALEVDRVLFSAEALKIIIMTKIAIRLFDLKIIFQLLILW